MGQSYPNNANAPTCPTCGTPPGFSGGSSTGSSQDPCSVPNTPYNEGLQQFRAANPFSPHPVRYATGELFLQPTDLVVTGPAGTWTHRRSYANQMNQVVDEGFGYGWLVSTQPYLARTDSSGDTVIVVEDANQALWFDRIEMLSLYQCRFGNYVLSFYEGDDEFRLIYPDGRIFYFRGLDDPDAPGVLSRWIETNGVETTVTSYAAGKPEILERSTTNANGDLVTEQLVYAYHASGADVGRMESLVWRRQVGTGGWTNLKRVRQVYYGASESYGSPGDLKFVHVDEWDSSNWAERETSYYRYWKAGQTGGYEHALQFALGPEAYERLLESYIDPDTPTDEQIAVYAEYYFSYDADRRVVKERVQGVQCGRAEYGLTLYEYTSSANADEFNYWKYKTIETRPDGSHHTVYTNYASQVILKHLSAPSTSVTEFFDREISDGQIVRHASPSAIISFDDTTPDLSVALRTDAGLLREYEYYTPAVGIRSGLLQTEYLRHGTNGTQIPLRMYEYAAYAPSGWPHNRRVEPVSRLIEFREEGGGDPVETLTNYYYWPDSTQVLLKQTYLPAVSQSQNGSGLSAMLLEEYDPEGRLTWSQNARGVIDELGRQTQSLGPVHTIDLNGTATQIRTATWAVYRDDIREIWTASGYQIVSDQSFVLINPVQIVRRDYEDRVIAQISAVRSSTVGKLLLTDSFPQSSWVRWTDIHFSHHCQKDRQRVYHTIPASGEGSASVNYDQTDYAYDSMGRLNRTRTPGGTITRTIYNPRDLLLSTWVGTDDTGATNSDPTGGGTPGNNMVLVTSYEYDNGLSTGDGNLTREIQHVNASTTRITNYAYDFRNRRVIIDGEIDYFQRVEYDNLDRLVKAERYDTTASGNLIERSETKYDDLSRVYQTIQYGVDPATGNLAGGTLVDDMFYDAAGNLTKVDPADIELYREYTYDSLNQMTSETNPRNAVTTFTYDPNGERITLTDAEDNTTSWGRDGIGRVVKETNELNDSRTFVYNSAGELSSKTDRDGRVTEFEYDDAGRLTTEQWKDGSTTVNTLSQTYDAESNVLTISDLVSAYSYTYDGRARLATASNSGTTGVPTVVLSLKHNRLNERTELATTTAGTADFVNSYLYDKLGRTQRIEQSGVTGGNSVADKRVDWEFASIGAPNKLSRYEDLTATHLVAETFMVYDNFQRLLSQTHQKGSTTLGSSAVTYDSNRRIDSLTTPDGVGNFTYDGSGELLDADYDFQTDEAFTYDLTGNRTMSGYSTGANNQLLSDGTYNYTYDKEGNRTRKTTISSDDYVEYEWDHRNRLTNVTFRDSSNTRTKEVLYTYDVWNRRLRRQLDSNGDGTINETENIVYDAGVKSGLEDILFIFDGSGARKHRFLHGPNVDQPLADETSTGVSWLLAGHLGTITEVAEYDSGTDTITVVNHLTYTSFGQMSSQTNAGKEPYYTYTAREGDVDTELFYYRARWYDAKVGRFVSEDPIGFYGGDANLFRYVQNSVTLLTDPTGYGVGLPATPPTLPPGATGTVGRLCTRANPLVGAVATGVGCGCLLHEYVTGPALDPVCRDLWDWWYGNPPLKNCPRNDQKDDERIQKCKDACYDVFEHRNEKCRGMPSKTKSERAKRALCWAKSMNSLSDCYKTCQ